MSAKILLVDTVEKHRQVVRKFLATTHPDVELDDYDPSADDTSASNISWGDYFLLIIDNQLGDQNGIEWVKTQQDAPDFPPVIFLSSTIDPNSLESSLQVDKAREAGRCRKIFI